MANVIPIPNPPPITTNAQGDKTFGFTWPAPATTGRFLLCATASGDTASNPLKSTTPYLVDSTAAPAITVMLAPNPTATGTPATGSTYTNGDQAIVSGTDFWPAGVAIDVYITDVPKPQNPAQLGTQATIVNRQIDPTDSNGTFAVTITVKVPAGQTGVFYVDAVSRDGSTADGYLPADLASQSITVVSPAPTPTVSPTATADPTPATKTTTTPTSTGDGGSGHILAAAGLGTLSVLLLVIGSMLLISAGRRPQPGG
jgi:hypothetical protein